MPNICRPLSIHQVKIESMNKGTIRSHAKHPLEKEIIGWLESHPGKQINLLPKRVYPGAAQAANLIDFLNSQSETRIERLLKEVENSPVRDFEKLLRWANVEGRPGRKMESKIRHAADVPRNSLTINAILSSYKLMPVLYGIRNGKWIIDWRPVQRFGEGAELEANAIVSLIELATQGLLYKVRRCRLQNCKKWFYARKENQGFCRVGCQQVCYKTDADYLKKHREHAKRLRDIERQRQARAREQVGFVSRKRRKTKLKKHRHW